METALIVVAFFCFVSLWNWWDPPLSDLVKKLVRAVIIIIGLPVMFIVYKAILTFISGYLGLPVADLAIMAYLGAALMIAWAIHRGDLQFKENQNSVNEGPCGTLK